MEEQIINQHIKCYLIGAMESTNSKDEGVGWRSRLRPELQKRVDANKNPIYVFDPTVHEEEKVGMPTKEFHAQLDKWIASGNLQKVADGMDCIWRGKTSTGEDDQGNEIQKHVMGDIDYVRKSNFLILNIDEGDKPCLHKDTLITMADFTKKKIKDIKEGDYILGTISKNKKTYFVPSKVIGQYNKGYKKVYNLLSNFNNIICTPDHKFLVASKRGSSIYKTAEEIVNKNLKIWDIEHTDNDLDFYKGWICGYLDNDAHLRSNKWGVQINIASDKQTEVLKIKKILENFKLTNIKISSKKGIDKRYPKSITWFLNIYNRNDYNKVIKILKTKESKQFKKGWITGAIDADGWYDKWDIRYSQSEVNFDNYLKMKDYLKSLHIKINEQVRSRETNFSKLKNKDFILSFSKKYLFLLPSQFLYKRKMKNKTLNGINKSRMIKNNNSFSNVYDITTETGNFIANGIITHNCGTYAEAFLAFERRIPIYMIQNNMALKDYNKSLLGWVIGSGGAIFPNQKQLLEFLDKEYKLKVKK